MQSKWEGGEQGRGCKRAKKWRTARLGTSSPWRVERPSSGETRDGGAARARRVAGGLGSPAQNRGGRERRERERDLPDSNLNFFSKFSIGTRKVLNTKVIPNFEPYHFCFRLIFIWGSVQKLNLKSRRTYVISRFEFELKFS